MSDRIPQGYVLQPGEGRLIDLCGFSMSVKAERCSVGANRPRALGPAGGRLVGRRATPSRPVCAVARRTRRIERRGPPGCELRLKLLQPLVVIDHPHGIPPSKLRLHDLELGHDIWLIVSKVTAEDRLEPHRLTQ
jgi:hypothetical protein